MTPRVGIALLLLAAVGGAVRAATHRDDFRHGLAQWIVEQQPGGTVTAADGVLRIDDRGGVTVWFRARLRAPVVISYDATVRSTGRVSDLNCFWMATDPAHGGGLFGAADRRDGRFAAYDTLRTYYVGCGGNDNTTTRFRRYDGTGARPLDPGFDRREREFLLEPDRTYHLELTAEPGGRVQYRRDVRVFFDFHDPAPLTDGWFGFRTVQSRIEIRNFQVEEGGANN